MRTGITFPLAPTGESGSTAMDEIYDELWDLNVANIRHYIGARAYRNTLPSYLEDCRTHGSADADGITFLFYEGDGCLLSSALCQHWFQVSMSTLATQLKPVLAGLGTGLAQIRSVKKAHYGVY